MRSRIGAGTICAGAAALTMGLPAGAQEGDGEKPLPEPYYVEYMMGRYAAPGRCGTEHVEELMVVTAIGVQIGDVLCEGIGKRHWEDGWMVVPLSTCRIDQRDQGPRTLRLQRLTGGDLGVRSNAENPFVPNEVMQRCGP